MEQDGGDNASGDPQYLDDGTSLAFPVALCEQTAPI